MNITNSHETVSEPLFFFVLFVDIRGFIMFSPGILYRRLNYGNNIVKKIGIFMVSLDEPV